MCILWPFAHENLENSCCKGLRNALKSKRSITVTRALFPLVANKANCKQRNVLFIPRLIRYRYIKNTTVCVSILLYNTSTEETFKGRSAGCTAIDMHRLLWGKHDFRVKNKDQQAHCSPGAYFFSFCAFVWITNPLLHYRWDRAGVAAVMMRKWREHLGL